MENLCCPKLLTTYQAAYKTVKSGKHAFKKAGKMPQADETLISGYFKNNLVVNGVQQMSKVWPKSTWGVEEYKEFLERLKCCKKELYKLYYNCPGVDTASIERMLRDLERSVYQVDYSSNEYVPRTRNIRRMLKLYPEKTNMKYYETTYRTYYNRIEELTRYMEYMKGHMWKYYPAELRKELNAIHRNGKTTYYSELCVPAMVMSEGVKVPERPVDRYTFRRL